MKYNVSKSKAPEMPNLGKGTECIKLLLSQASKDMHEPLVPMFFPALAAHLKDVEFMYSDNKYYELCGQMGHLIDPSGVGKAQLTHLVEAIMRPNAPLPLGCKDFSEYYVRLKVDSMR